MRTTNIVSPFSIGETGVGFLDIGTSPAVTYMIDFYFALTVSAAVALVVLLFWAALVAL
jgi:hypothetical protein